MKVYEILFMYFTESLSLSAPPMHAVDCMPILLARSMDVVHTAAHTRLSDHYMFTSAASNERLLT